MNQKGIVVLGSTGSIGESAFRVLENFPERFDVVGLAARSRVDRLAQQAAKLHARYVVTTDTGKVGQLASLLPPGYHAMGGDEAMIELVTRPDVAVVLCAIVGTAGLLPVMAALRAGKTVALASKEVLVMAGEMVMDLVHSGHGRIIPVDSEHSAIFQCLASRDIAEVDHLILTASGGAFRNSTLEEMRHATWKRALQHPTWNMGEKVTIDSASLMNKALEIVEAGYLFGVGPEKIQVMIHPQSVVHSMVSFCDGSLIAQMAKPDMRLAIQYALSYPERWGGCLPQLGVRELSNLQFFVPDEEKYPSLRFARRALQRGGALPAVMNAANEVAVRRFRDGKIAFTGIWTVIEETMAAYKPEMCVDLENIFAGDAWAREFAAQVKA